MKKLAIMQPYFLPYIGYFSLIKQTDDFILLDTVQFIRHGWIERNRILKQDSGWLYIKVPLEKHDRETLIKDITIDNSQDWKAKIMAQLQVYKKTAPNFDRVTQLLNALFAREYTDIVSLNKASLELVCSYLGISKKIDVFSKMNLDIEPPQTPDEWALNICRAIGGVSEYWNPPGGQAFFDRAKYEAAGIAMRYQTPVLQSYDQKRKEFESGLSIIDVMMFNSVGDINIMLDEYELT
jgi:hypothetical protein